MSFGRLSSIALLAFAATIGAFMLGSPILGICLIPAVIIFWLAAFLQWADMTNV